jgi:hypothetical protein
MGRTPRTDIMNARVLLTKNLIPGAIREMDSEDFMRNLDPKSMTLIFHGDTYDMHIAEDAVNTILPKAKDLTSDSWSK